jgi:hypothetical protein
VRHRTAGPVPPANSTPIVAVVTRVVPSPAFRCEAGVAGGTQGGPCSRAPPVCVCGVRLVLGGALQAILASAFAKKKPHEPSAPPSESAKKSTRSTARLAALRGITGHPRAI